MSTATAEAESDEQTGGGKKKVLVVVLVLVLGAAAAWWFLLRAPAGAKDEPEPGEVVALDPIQVNLAGGHYLSVGIALQTVKGAEELDGSKALDAVIELYSGREQEELVRPKGRQKLKGELRDELADLYEHEVMDVYLTQFVTQ